MKTKNTKLSALVAGLFSLLLLGPSFNANAQSEMRKVGNFSKVSFSLPGTLEIVQGKSVSLMIEGDKDNIAQIVTEVEGDNLKIYCNRNNYHFGEITVKLTVVDLNDMSLAGSGDIVVKSSLKTGELDIHLSGSGDVEALQLTADDVDAHLAGSGDINLAGNATKSFEVHIAGSGNVNAQGLESSKVEVNIAGSGTAKVNASDKLNTNIVGSGNVYYKGRPLVNAQSSGSGKTKPL